MVSGASSSDARGRLVPSFVNTFATPSTSWVSSGNSSSSPFLALASAPSGGLPSTSYPSATIGPLLPHSIGPLPFIVGPGYAPISAKTVGALGAGKYINLADLLPAENAYAFDESNLECFSPCGWFMYFHSGRVVHLGLSFIDVVVTLVCDSIVS